MTATAVTYQHPLAPGEIWAAWNADPLTVAGILLAVWLYRAGRLRGRQPSAHPQRSRYFAGAVAATAVALISPLDALSGTLASAHMVQHLLLILVAAPLVALSAPTSTLLRGIPLGIRRTLARWRLHLRLTRNTTRFLRHPGFIWVAHVGTLWFWHAAVPYNAALRYNAIHVLEHATFLLTAIMLWVLAVGIWRTGRLSPGFGVVLMFATAMQGVFLSALLTFARTPWYTGYDAEAIRAWGLEPLADQQLAGVIMWIPGGVAYLVTALMLLALWIRGSEAPSPDTQPPTAVRDEAASAGLLGR